MLKSLFNFKSLLAVLAGVLFAASFLNFDLYLIQWFCFVPLLLAIENTSVKKSYWLGTLAGTVALAGGTYWISFTAKVYWGLPFPLHYLGLLLYALFNGQIFAIICFIYQWAKKRSKLTEYCLFPLLIVTVWSVFPVLFRFQPADTQSYFLTAIQPLEFTGMFGLNLIIGVANFLIYRLIRFKQLPLPKLFIASTMGLIVIWFASGSYLLKKWDQKIETWNTKKIGIIQPNHTASLFREKPKAPYTYRNPQEMVMTKELVKNKPDLVLWPEGYFFGFSFWGSVKRSFLRKAGEMETPIIFQDSTFEKKEDGEKLFRNTAIWLTETGKLGGQYHKRLLVPFGEYVPMIEYFKPILKMMGMNMSNLTPGTEYKEFKIRGMNVIPIICYESIFPRFVGKAIGENGAGKFIVVLTQDGWYGKGPTATQHMGMTVLRAIENRVPIAHAINNGPSAIVLPNGRYVFNAPFYEEGAWAIDMPYNSKSGGTLFSKNPDIFLGLIWLAAILILAMAAFTKKQEE